MLSDKFASGRLYWILVQGSLLKKFWNFLDVLVKSGELAKHLVPLDRWALIFKYDNLNRYRNVYERSPEIIDKILLEISKV